MQKDIYNVEWLNKMIRVTVVNSPTMTEEEPGALERALLCYLRRVIFEMSPKFKLEKLEFFLQPEHFEQDPTNLSVRRFNFSHLSYHCRMNAHTKSSAARANALP